MRLLSTLTAVVLAVGFNVAQAQELDNESQVTNAQIEASRELPATLVIRSNDANNQVEVLHAHERLATDSVTIQSLNEKDFVKTDLATTMKSELDQNSSASSWYFWWNGAYSYPTYYYSGYSYNYASYYSYRHAGYTYWYCRWAYGWWY
ncbi:MAG: hypothetical protein V4760_05375 [Bdellovibrionota bacterium]